MAKKPSTGQDVLDKSNHLTGVCQKAKRLIKMRDLISTILPLELQAECQVANYRHGTLILYVHSSAWCSRLRLLLPNLLKRLKLVDAFNKLEKIEIKVRPPAVQKTTRLESAPLSEYGKNVLSELKTLLPD